MDRAQTEGRDRTYLERLRRQKCLEGLQKSIQISLTSLDMLRDDLPRFSQDNSEEHHWSMIALQGQEFILIAQEMLGRDLGYLKPKDLAVQQRTLEVLEDLLEKVEERFNLVK